MCLKTSRLPHLASKVVCPLLYATEGTVPSGQSESPSGEICYRGGYEITEITASNQVSETLLKRCLNDVRLLNATWQKTARLAVAAH